MIGKNWTASEWAWFVIACGFAAMLVIGALRGRDDDGCGGHVRIDTTVMHDAGPR